MPVWSILIEIQRSNKFYTKYDYDAFIKFFIKSLFINWGITIYINLQIFIKNFKVIKS